MPVSRRHTPMAGRKAPPVGTGGAFSVPSSAAAAQLVQVCVPAGTAIALNAFSTATHSAAPVP